jgi:hypothetical protein
MAKKKQTKLRKYAPRQTRQFQLRLDHAQDAHVLEVLNFARSQRREVTVIRESIALYWALENGNLEALFDVFPQYKAQFAPSTAEALEQFMEILRQQQLPIASGAGQSIKYDPPIPLPAPPIVEVKQSAGVSANTIADNFLSMFNE